MLTLDHIPLHWKTQRALLKLCDDSGIDWTQTNPANQTKSRQLHTCHGFTIAQAAAALRRNLRWHGKHPGRFIRNGDIPF